MTDPDEMKIQATTDVLTSRFDERKQKQLEGLAKAREVRKANLAALKNVPEVDKEPKGNPEQKSNPNPSVWQAKETYKPVVNLDLIWREAMVAQITSGKIVSAKQLPIASQLADAYVEMFKSKFGEHLKIQ
jgi:hypothetical protein